MIMARTDAHCSFALETIFYRLVNLYLQHGELFVFPIFKESPRRSNIRIGLRRWIK